MASVTLTHPIDQTKMRSQVQHPRRGMVDTARATLVREGVRGLWAGLTGSWVRQATYGSMRFGMYGWLNERDRVRSVSASSEGGAAAMGSQRGRRARLVRNGAIAGVLAGLVGAPGGQSLFCTPAPCPESVDGLASAHPALVPSGILLSMSCAITLQVPPSPRLKCLSTPSIVHDPLLGPR